MTLRDLHLRVATDNHAPITVSKIGAGVLCENKYWGEIPKKYKDSEVWMAYPIKADHCAVKRWRVILE